MDGGFPEHDLEQHSPGANRDSDEDDRDVLEQHPERQQHDAECRQGVEAREWRRQERAERAPERGTPKAIWLSRCPNRKPRRRREMRSRRRTIRISAAMKRCCLGPARLRAHQRWGSQI